jgi:hypothetical protein
MARDVLKATPEQIERTMTVGKRVAPDEIDAFKGSALKEFFDSAGHQGDISPRKLVTQYSKKGKQIKALLGDDKEAIQMVEDIVEVAKRVGERPGANPSGTAPMITLAMSMWGIQSLDPATMAKVGSAALGTRLFAHGVNHPAGRSVLKMMLDPPGAAIGTPLGRQQFSHLILQLAKSMEESENE